ncbi:hypothetical protein BT96DRAFT_658591 [Gymnopus androsaceus JB14]|uniref:T4 RNA ligase 1-like N-terminal domain-containing protein n=1 Tax=Gymnopus androsaceus JB14 TaxID=1447944 RepID=A0A6A4HQ80_9AGAR|nr:hypothetical protein BT96DRAFT_658591 [Gymnopus androsaceus JB14]
MAARVLVVETNTGAVVSRAFSKFFNYHEGNAYKPTGDELVVKVEEKLDGSIISLFWYKHQWILTSKSRFDSVHVKMAQEVLDKKYPRVTKTLPTDRTYVFELIHPENSTQLVYAYMDLVLLSVIGKDGSEPPPEFDWSVYPFPRPVMNEISITDLNAVRRLNRVNEEGFVVKFYLGNDSLHPQRIKVKFESFLDLIKSKNYHNPKELKELYIRKRNMIYTFDEEEVKNRMAEQKKVYFEGLRRIADDFGGEKWVSGVLDVWSKIDSVFVEDETELRRAIAKLVDEGFGEHIGTRDSEIKRRFAQRIMQEQAMSKYKNVLFIWISGVGIDRQVSAFSASVRVPMKEMDGVELKYV